MSGEDAMRVGFIGLGNMGEPLAGFVREAGFSLVVHDLRQEAAVRLLERGAEWAASPRDVAARGDVICICVPGPPEMHAVTLGPGGVLEGVAAGAVVSAHTPNAPAAARPAGGAGAAVVIAHTTTPPAVVRAVGEALKARGAHLLDAPLDGGREGALEGKVTLFVGGDEAVLRRVRPILDTFSKAVVRVGELGAGSIAKLVHNALAMGIDRLLAGGLTRGGTA